MLVGHRNRPGWPTTRQALAAPRSTQQSETILVLEEGLDEGGTLPVAAFALHGGARFQTGMVRTRPGPILASADAIEAVIHGQGGHAGLGSEWPGQHSRGQGLLAPLGKCPSTRPPDWCKVDPLAAPSLLKDAAKRTRT
jgi:hypothetical protein